MRTGRRRRHGSVARRAGAVYRIILDMYLRDGIPPTLDQVASAVGIPRGSYTRWIMYRLVEIGLLRRVRRTFVPTDVLRIPPRCPSCGGPVRVRIGGGRKLVATWVCDACKGGSHR